MNREIIFHENHFIEFYQVQNDKVKEKIKYVLELIKQVEKVPEKFLKHLTNTNGLYEIRIEYQSNIYRIFCCFDKGKLVADSIIHQMKYELNSTFGWSINDILFNSYF